MDVKASRFVSFFKTVDLKCVQTPHLFTNLSLILLLENYRCEYAYI